MARYSCSFSSRNPIEILLNHLGEALRSCDIEIIYRNNEYVVGREKPGNVAFTKLVTVEALIDYQGVTSSKEVHLNCILKNEELPLKQDNHCRRVFDTVKRKIESQTPWQLQ